MNRSRSYRVAIAATLAWSLLATAGLWAQDESTPTEEPAAAEEGETGVEHEITGEVIFVEGSIPAIPTSSSVASKLPMPLQITPASVGVVTSALIEEQNGLVLGDALRNVSGLNVQTGNGAFDFFVVRGLDSVTGSSILVDGAREPESSFYQMYNVDRVEVLKGPSSFLYGGGPLGGTVNLVRKQPQAVDFVGIGASYGSFNTVDVDLDANLANTEGDLNFRLGTYWRQSDGYRDGRDSEVLALYPSLNFRPSERTSWTFSLEALDLDYSPDAGLPIGFDGEVVDVPRRRSYQSDLDRSEQDVGRFQVDFETQLSDKVVLRDKLFYRSLDWLSETTVFNGVFPDNTGGQTVSRTLLALDDSQGFLGNEIEAVMRLGGDGITHQLLIGLETSRLADDFTFDAFFLSGVDLDDPQNPPQEQLFPIPGQDRSADATTVIIAPYVVDQIAFSDQWQVLLGARLDLLDFEDKVSGVSRDDSEVSPMLGLVFAPSNELSFYGNVSESFAPPSTFAVAEDQVPEESRQWELGVKKSFLAGRGNASLALYSLERENVAIPDETGILQQVGSQEAQGVELEVSAETAGNLEVYFTYAYTDSELTEFTETQFVGFFPPMPVTVDLSGNKTPFTPENLSSLWVTKRLDNGLGFGAGGRWVDDQYIAEDNAFQIDGYFLLDAAIHYARGPWRIRLNLDNLTGEDYYTRGFGTSSVIPAAGFTASSGIDYSF